MNSPLFTTDSERLETWRHNDRSFGVTLPVGVVDPEGEKLFSLSLSPKGLHYRGIFAFVQGATGSGKTNLIEGLIRGGVTTYSPDKVQFIVRSFTQDACHLPETITSLPHVSVGSTLTDEESVEEFITELRAEVKLRTKALEQTSTETLEDYQVATYTLEGYTREGTRQKLTHMPYKVIVLENLSCRSERLQKIVLEEIFSLDPRLGFFVILSGQNINAQKIYAELTRSVSWFVSKSWFNIFMADEKLKGRSLPLLMPISGFRGLLTQTVIAPVNKQIEEIFNNLERGEAMVYTPDEFIPIIEKFAVTDAKDFV